MFVVGKKVYFYYKIYFILVIKFLIIRDVIENKFNRVCF